MFDQETSQWKIVNIFNLTEVVAHTKPEPGQQGRTSLPLGFHPWYFPTSACTDPGEEEVAYRTLNLHPDVEQPGNFCCDDGTCISSALVCNDFPECQVKWATAIDTLRAWKPTFRYKDKKFPFGCL